LGTDLGSDNLVSAGFPPLATVLAAVVAVVLAGTVTYWAFPLVAVDLPPFFSSTGLVVTGLALFKVEDFSSPACSSFLWWRAFLSLIT